MKKFYCTCKYCNNRWQEPAWQAYNSLKCARCGDSNIKIHEVDTVDYYDGSPPFETCTGKSDLSKEEKEEVELDHSDKNDYIPDYWD